MTVHARHKTHAEIVGAILGDMTITTTEGGTSLATLARLLEAIVVEHHSLIRTYCFPDGSMIDHDRTFDDWRIRS